MTKNPYGAYRDRTGDLLRAKPNRPLRGAVGRPLSSPQVAESETTTGPAGHAPKPSRIGASRTLSGRSPLKAVAYEVHLSPPLTALQITHFRGFAYAPHAHPVVHMSFMNGHSGTPAPAARADRHETTR